MLRIIAVFLLCLALPAAADETFPNFINGQSLAATPLVGGERVPVIQSGVTKYLPPYLNIGGQSVALGTSTTNQGTGSKIQLATGSFTAGDCPVYDSSGNLIDSGSG